MAACVGHASATGLQRLEDFVRTVKSGQAEFTQVVTAPTKAGQAPKVKTSNGTFEFSRPNRFRFNYLKPFAQTIVADGQSLWFFDEDLNQVTLRQQAAVLSSTPAALIAAAPDVRALQADFALTDVPDQDGLQWVQAIPKSKEGQLRLIRIGFGQTLQVLEIQDNFGQRSVLTFKGLRVNPVLSATVFDFKVPAGVDLLRQ